MGFFILKKLKLALKKKGIQKVHRNKLEDKFYRYLTYIPTLGG